MKRLLLFALTAGLSMPCLAQEKEIIYSEQPSFEKATIIAGSKTAVECLIDLGGKYTKENMSELYKSLGISSADLSGPLVNLIADEYKKYISDDCRIIEESGAINAGMKIDNQYDIRFKPKAETRFQIPIKEFNQAAKLLATDICRVKKGIKESAFAQSKLPLKYSVNENLRAAAFEITPLLDSDCSVPNDSNEQAEEIISKYFEEQ